MNFVKPLEYEQLELVEENVYKPPDYLPDDDGILTERMSLWNSMKFP